MESQHHWGWIVVAVLCLGAVTYIFTINRPDENNYSKGSSHIEQHRQDWPFSIHIGEGGCATLDALKAKKEIKSDPKTHK